MNMWLLKKAAMTMKKLTTLKSSPTAATITLNYPSSNLPHSLAVTALSFFLLTPNPHVDPSYISHPRPMVYLTQLQCLAVTEFPTIDSILSYNAVPQQLADTTQSLPHPLSRNSSHCSFTAFINTPATLPSLPKQKGRPLSYMLHLPPGPTTPTNCSRASQSPPATCLPLPLLRPSSTDPPSTVIPRQS